MTNKEALGSLGRTIKGQRARIGLSQTELANLAEVSLNFVSQMERGKPTAQIGKVLDLLSALGLCFSLEYGKNRILSQIIEDRR